VLKWTLALAVAVFTAQAPALTPDAPHKCDDCEGWNKAREPFRIYGNTYFVGSDGLSSILVVGNAGHILLDGGLEQTAPLIDANIRKLGFKTQDIKLIVNSHGHFDHAAGIAALQRFTGATVAASASGAKALMDGIATPDDPQAGFPRAFNAYPPVKGVRVVKDGETQRVGNISVTPIFTPGHTPGSTTWTWQSCEDVKCLNMVYADSISAATGPGYRYSDHPDVIAQLRRSISRLGELPCDIVVSTHPSATGLDAKVQKRASRKTGDPDPFIDQGCRTLAANALKGLEAKLAEEKKQ
jgi:metallo-beta-lactamase class B